MSIKVLFFSIYIFSILLLIMLPLNNNESVINNTYFLSIRSDYLGHLVMFSPWMWLNPLKSYKSSKSHWLLTGMVFASLCEVIQFLLPYRTFNINDIVANGTGILLSGLCYILFTKK